MHEYSTIYPTPWTLLETEQSKIRFITNKNYRKSVEKWILKMEVDSYVNIDIKSV